jgi:hypothetical protein
MCYLPLAIGYLPRRRIPWPETHARAQPLRSEAPYAKTARKSTTYGIPAPRLPPYVVYFALPRFALPNPVPRLVQERLPYASDLRLGA